MARYSYLEDLRTDIRPPRSLLDALNIVLRRFLLIAVATGYRHDDGTHCVRWRSLRLRCWPAYYERFTR